MRLWGVTVALCLLAVVLSTSLLRYTESHNLTHEDYSVTQSIPDEPILVTSWSVADFVCLEEQKVCDRALAVVRGLYPRQGIPFVMAFAGGFVLPQLLIVAAVAYQVRRRWVNIVALCAAAAVMSLVMLDFTISQIRFYDRPAGTDIQQRISTEAIWITKIDADTGWCMVGPPENKCDFARVNGVFARRGISRNAAIIFGIAIPLSLFLGVLYLGTRRPRS